MHYLSKAGAVDLASDAKQMNSVSLLRTFIWRRGRRDQGSVPLPFLPSDVLGLGRVGNMFNSILFWL